MASEKAEGCRSLPSDPANLAQKLFDDLPKRSIFIMTISLNGHSSSCARGRQTGERANSCCPCLRRYTAGVPRPTASV